MVTYREVVTVHRVKVVGDLEVIISFGSSWIGFFSTIKKASTDITKMAADLVDKSANGAIVWYFVFISHIETIR